MSHVKIGILLISTLVFLGMIGCNNSPVTPQTGSIVEAEIVTQMYHYQGKTYVLKFKEVADTLSLIPGSDEMALKSITVENTGYFINPEKENDFWIYNNENERDALCEQFRKALNLPLSKTWVSTGTSLYFFTAINFGGSGTVLNLAPGDHFDWYPTTCGTLIYATSVPDFIPSLTCGVYFNNLISSIRVIGTAGQTFRWYDHINYGGGSLSGMISSSHPVIGPNNPNRRYVDYKDLRNFKSGLPWGQNWNDRISSAKDY